MGKIPDDLRETIARNIRNCRQLKYPGRGGGKKCAEAFGVSPQQWSPWERGKRTPDEDRLQKIAEFLGVTVEYLRKDNRNETQPPPTATDEPQSSEQNLGHASTEATESFFVLAHHFINLIMTYGLSIKIGNGYTPPLQWPSHIFGQPPFPPRQ